MSSQEEQKQLPIAFLSIDVEHTNPCLFRKKFFAFGGTLYAPDKDIIVDSFCVSFPPIEDAGPSWKWWKEEKQQKALKYLSQQATTREQGARTLLGFFEKYRRMYNIYVHTDNPACDGGFFDMFVQEYLSEHIQTTLPFFLYPQEYRSYYTNHDLVIEIATRVYKRSDVRFNNDQMEAAMKKARCVLETPHLPDQDAMVNSYYVAILLKAYRPRPNELVIV